MNLDAYLSMDLPVCHTSVKSEVLIVDHSNLACMTLVAQPF